MSVTGEVAVIGAGPYGLSAAVHLRRAGVEAHVFGDPMSFWRGMPRGMKLRSNWSASNIAEPSGELSLAAYQAETGDRFGAPVPLERFISYGTWLQQRAVPDVDPRRVTRLARERGRFVVDLEDGERLEARRVVVACGIAHFAWRPPGFGDLPAELASHTGEHHDLGRFAQRRVAVVGAGQSALESAALLREAGAQPEVFIRRSRVVWLRGTSVHRRLGPLAPVVYAPTDVGPLWYNRLVAVPELFGRLPRRLQAAIARRCIRPACSPWVRERLDGVPLNLGRSVAAATPTPDGRLALRLDDGETREVDHLLFGTGYRVDVGRYPFLAPELLHALERRGGYPVLRPGLESSVLGLHFLGAPAAWSFGPTMRFVSGSWYGARAMAAAISAQRRSRRGTRVRAAA